MDNEFLMVVKILAAQIPEMAIMLLGIIFALAHWGKHPRPALLSFLGFGILLIVNIAFWIFVFMARKIDPALSGETPVVIAMGARSFLAGGAYLLLAFAIYAGRKPRIPLPPHQ